MDILLTARTISYLISNILQTYGLVILIDAILQGRRRVSNQALFIAWSVFYVVRSCAFIFLPLTPALNVTLTMVALFVMALMYEASTLLRLLAMAFCYVMGFAADWLSGMAVVAFTGESLAVVTTEPRLVVMNMVFAGIMVLGLCALSAHNFRKSQDDKSDLPRAYLIAAFAIPMLSVAAFYGIGLSALTGQSISVVALCGYVVVLITINMLVFYLYRKLLGEQKVHFEKTLLEQQMLAYSHELDMEQENNRRVRALRHDMVNHLIAIRNMAHAQKQDELDAYLDTIDSELERKNEYVHTCYPALDGLVNYKLGLAERNGATIKADVIVPNQFGVSTFDLSVILGNLLDNAVEALALYEGVKELCMDVSMRMDVLCLRIENTYDGEKRKTASGQYLTRKDRPEVHGLGLENVRKIIEQYDGLMKIEDENNRFVVNVLLYPHDEKE